MAVKLPYYSIVPCCSQSTMSGNFYIPGTALVANGVYVYNGVSFQEPITGMWFYSGFCYTVQYINNDFTIYPPAFNFVDISSAIGNTCSSPDCLVCDVEYPPAFSVYECCDAANVVNLNINTAGCGTTDGTWVYTGTGFITATGFEFLSGSCYNFTSLPYGLYTQGPDCNQFTITSNSCQKAQNKDQCPACDLGLQYLKFQSCCSENYILFRGSDVASYFGVREYLGTLVDGLENICYSITIGNVGDLFVPDLAAYNLLPFPPVYIEGVTFSTLSAVNTDCKLYTAECPQCNPQCYTLYNCDGESFNTTLDLSGYLNSFILINDVLGVSGPWFVVENNGPCDGAINTFTVYPRTPEPCKPQCYDIQGQGTVTYLGYDLVLRTDYLPIKICSYIYPQVTGTFTITSYGDCTFTHTGLECPELCFLLTNCVTGEQYNSNSQNLLNNVGQVVTINGYDGCYTVDINLKECNCPINATVLTSYATCQDCLPIVAYKLTNCTNPAQVQYTYQDLSAYVGHGVELECGQCWVVEQIDYAPPSVQNIVIAFDFENCTACARTYYLLTDCAGFEPDVYTFTDLSAYVGLVIKLKDCKTCWTVQGTRLLASPASIVTFEQEYVDCLTCQIDAPCVCSTIRNDQTLTTAFKYVDCFGVQQRTPSILPGETSDKICLQRWLNNVDQTNYVKYYGDCTNSSDQFVCPPPVYNLVSVRPGYNTPACSIEAYERITCKAAQILYRNVLTLRYGISNCCPEDDQYWLIKKELIDLAALYDPAYPCAPNDPCGCGCGSQGSCGSSCGCGQPDDCSCNQPRSCNS